MTSIRRIDPFLCAPGGCGGTLGGAVYEPLVEVLVGSNIEEVERQRARERCLPITERESASLGRTQ